MHIYTHRDESESLNQWCNPRGILLYVDDDLAKNQLDRFKEAARQLETDDDEARFEEKLK